MLPLSSPAVTQVALESLSEVAGTCLQIGWLVHFLNEKFRMVLIGVILDLAVNVALYVEEENFQTS